ncbi:MAG: YgjV family protein [Clostridia bacterium]|nr:YgjV family protein [Clostridia bacterium]MBQ7100478.1 YgjV family protein [Clostridia bacterium]
MLETIGQIIGFVAMGIIVFSYQQKSHKNILTFQMVSGLLFTVHYLFLGAYTGCISNLIGAGRSAIYANRGKNSFCSAKLWPVIFSIVFIVSGIPTWLNIFSVFPMIAMVVSSVVLWIDSPKINRAFSIPTSACWLIYNIANLSYAGIATEIFVLSSIIIGMIRLDRKKTEK